MTPNEKELILAWLSIIEEAASNKRPRRTLKADYQECLNSIIKVVHRSKEYLLEH